MKLLTYRDTKKYKYRLEEDFSIYIGSITSRIAITKKEDYSHKEGVLTINKGYLWDGVSGPAIDTENTMVAGLVHDVLYQMIRERVLPISYKEQADNILQSILIKEGMSNFRAWYYYKAVDLFGGYSCVPGRTNKIIYKIYI